jgi:hypothetical protein
MQRKCSALALAEFAIAARNAGYFGIECGFNSHRLHKRGRSSSELRPPFRPAYLVFRGWKLRAQPIKQERFRLEKAQGTVEEHGEQWTIDPQQMRSA